MSGLHDAAKAIGCPDDVAKALFDQILHHVKEFGRLTIPNFGTFAVKRMAARTIISPQIPNGRADVPARNALKFHQAPALREILNEAKAKAKGTPPAKKKLVPKPQPEVKAVVGRTKVNKSVAEAPVAKPTPPKVKKAPKKVAVEEEAAAQA